MGAPGWLSQLSADVPAGDEWLGDNERAVLAGLRMQQRRAAWCLGRWTAKAALGRWLGVAPRRVEVLAAPDGAPEAWLEGERVAVSVSLSHRGGRALAVVTDGPRVAGCDIELIEPRSDAFVREWLSPPEQRLISFCDAQQRELVANLIWTGKEAAAKVRREGLRLDLRRAVVTVADPCVPAARWHPLEVEWDDGHATTSGWWRVEEGWVMAVAGDPPPEIPRALSARRSSV
jgi:4'-phosphopantetheinyl transferase